MKPWAPGEGRSGGDEEGKGGDAQEQRNPAEGNHGGLRDMQVQREAIDLKLKERAYIER